VSGSFFPTLGVRAAAGRLLAESDDVRGGGAVAVVSSDLARRRYGNVDAAVGRTLTLDRAAFTIVGVMPADFVGLDIGRRSDVVVPFGLAEAIGKVGPDLTLTFQPLGDQVNASLTQERITAELSGFFGVLAAVLAALGLYGVTAGSVSRRRTEIGIRMALGAAPSAIVRLVLTRVAWLVAIGVLVGTMLSLWVSSFIGAMLYGLQPRDPLTFAGSAALLAAVGIIAGWLPARRASRLEPAQVLGEA
jgi:hypothetical protein